MGYYSQNLTTWITTNCVKFLKRWEYKTILPAFWETCMQVKKQQLELDIGQQTGSKLGKEYVKEYVLSPCLFNVYAEYIMRNARLDEAQAGIKIARRNINNLRYADDTTLWQKVKGNLNESLDEVERGQLKTWLKIQHSEN